MVKVYGEAQQPANYTCADPFITTPVIVPYGCKSGCCDGCGPDGIPDHHLKTHARDAIKVSPKQAGVAVALDDGSGMGYLCPMPLDCMELRIRRKGTRCFCFTLRPVGIDDAGRLDIRFEPDFMALPLGYYEALIVFNPNTPIQAPGGWLLFWKQGPAAQTVSSYEPILPVRGADQRCTLTAPQVSVTNTSSADCDREDCGPCQ